MTSTPTLHQIDHLEGSTETITIIRTVASEWRQIATRLKFGHHDISRIEKDNPRDCRDACRQMFSEWLDGNGRKPITWKTLVNVLEESEHCRLARKLEMITCGT